jgi:hypothetical protein
VDWKRRFETLATPISGPYFTTIIYKTMEKKCDVRIKVENMDHLKQRIKRYSGSCNS